MKFENIVPKRRLTISITIVTLIAIFFIGYYFYYIPTNKEDLYKNGFLILENIKKSIADRNEDYKKLYKAFFDKDRSENIEAAKIHVQKLLDSNNVNGDVFSVTDTLFLKDEDDLLSSLSIENKKSKLRADIEQDRKIDQYGQRVPNPSLQCTNYRAFHFVHIMGDAADQVAFSFLCKKSNR